MYLHLPNLLTGDEVRTLREIASGRGEFDDGRKTAGWAARTVKDNEQLDAGPQIDAIRAHIRKALDKHPLYKAFAQPRAIVRMLVSRYKPGMEYGLHVDDALMGGQRTDLSFTVFLSDPETYQGGVLTLEDVSGTTEIKLPAGDAVVYPTGALHRVAPVAEGERLAVIGWVRSLIRRADQREVLFDLDLASRAVFEEDGKTPLFDTLSKTRSNLLRMWAED